MALPRKRDNVTYRQWAWVHITDRRLLVMLFLVVAVLAYFTHATSTGQRRLDGQQRQIIDQQQQLAEQQTQLAAQQEQLRSQARQETYVCNQLDESHQKVNGVLDRLALGAATAPGRSASERKLNSAFFTGLHLADLTCPPPS